MKKLLITGGCGFIGSHFCRMLLDKTDFKVTNLDALTYAGKIGNTDDFKDNPQYQFVKGDICNKDLVDDLVSQAEAVVNFAAESHVDNSIDNPGIFVQTNVLGTQNLLDAARRHSLERFVQVSTDEVYGDLPLEGSEKFTEHSELKPSSPYSASKAAGDMLCIAAHRTFGQPILISRCSNNYGTHQLEEKLMPLVISKAFKNEKIPVYGNGENVRDWIHVDDHHRAILAILQNGEAGEIYNVGADNEVTNIDLVKLLLKILGKDESLIEFVSDRPGHDRRYAIDSSKIQSKLGWRPKRTNFEKELAEMVEWYKLHNT
ncbi:dTDP-glucose 4,6-dehydratase [Candidatus Gracilibacteria bacterium]|nr:dTDP-glucose 4,6-dehydratase [Candidatus Gracilibacteria bacterium]